MGKGIGSLCSNKATLFIETLKVFQPVVRRPADACEFGDLILCVSPPDSVFSQTLPSIIFFFMEYEYDIDADTGAVLKAKRDWDD